MLKAVAVAAASVIAGGAYAVRSKVQENAASATGMGSLKERFCSHATVGHHDYMTLEDFIGSCCSSLRANGKNPQQRQLIVSDAMLDLFERTDADGDGLISFSEYCMLFSFLSVSDDMFRTAFHMFDRDESGSLDFAEFKMAMNALCVDPTAKLKLETSGITHQMFGKALDGKLKLDDFLQRVQRLRWDVRAVEFQQFAVPPPPPATLGQKSAGGKKKARAAVAPTGKVPLEDLRRMLGIEIEDKQQERAKGAGVNDNSGAKAAPSVAWATYAKLFDVIRESPTIERALTQITDAKRAELKSTDAAGGAAATVGATKPEFVRALRAANMQLTAEDIDVFFNVFDSDNSGSIDPDEFGTVCKLRRSFYATYLPRFDEPKRNAVQEFVYCMQQRT